MLISLKYIKILKCIFMYFNEINIKILKGIFMYFNEINILD